jgi:MFS transporter, FSR family, fosmidomycin resistance protein
MKQLFHHIFKNHSFDFVMLNSLHILNDGYGASMLLFLPFIANDMHIDLTEVGILGTLLNSLGFFLALPSSYLAKKWGGIRIIVGAVILYGLGYLLAGLASSYTALFPGFILAGIGFGMFHSIGFALIAKWSTKETRGSAMGDFTALGEVGKIGLSAALTLIIAFIGWRFTAFFYAGVALIIGILLLFLILKRADKVSTEKKQVVSISLRSVILHKRSLLANLANFCDSFAGSSLFIFIPFLLLYRGAEPALLGTLTAAFFFGNFAGKTLLGKLADKFNLAHVFITSEFIMAGLILIMAITPSLPVIIVCSVILGFFTKGTVPVIQTMVSEAAEHHGDFEKAFGANMMIARIATTIAPVVLGIVSDHWGIVSAFYVMAAAALIAIVPAFAFKKAS